MKISENTKKLVGIVWKIISVVVIIVLFVLNVFGDYSKSSAYQQKDLDFIQTQLKENIPKISAHEIFISRQIDFVKNVQESNKETKDILKAISDKMVEQGLKINEIKTELSLNKEFVKERLDKLEGRLDK